MACSLTVFKDTYQSLLLNYRFSTSNPNNNNAISNTQNNSNSTTVLPNTNYLQYQQPSSAFNINKNFTSTNNITSNNTDRYMTNPTN